MADLPNFQAYYKDLFEENARLRTKDEKQKEEIRLLRTQLEVERRSSRELKTEKQKFFSKKSELEELFMACIEEVRKDIARRKSVQLARDNNLNSTLKSKKATKFDDTLESAIKNEQFTAGDKRKVIDLLLSNENVLLFLYEKLFPRRLSAQSLVNQAHLAGPQ